jgi:hypothetical protein
MTIRSDKNSLYAVVDGTPNASDFTQIGEGEDGEIIVRLAICDLNNEAITKSFKFD